MSENLSRREALATALTLTVLPAVAGNALIGVVMDPPAAKKK